MESWRTLTSSAFGIGLARHIANPGGLLGRQLADVNLCQISGAGLVSGTGVPHSLAEFQSAAREYHLKPQDEVKEKL
jgi:hypothetical protein